jgi:hypothetical protein
LARLALVRGELDRARQHFSNALRSTKDLTPPAPQRLVQCAIGPALLQPRRLGKRR